MQNNRILENIIRKSYEAFLANDREGLEKLMADDYTFTSPNDDNINKDAFFLKCLPGSKFFLKQTIDKIFIQGNDAFVLYSAELKNGSKFKNVEYIRVENGKIKEVQVYFGASL